MKKLKKMGLVFLVLLLVGVPLGSVLTTATAMAKTETSSSKENEIIPESKIKDNGTKAVMEQQTDSTTSSDIFVSEDEVDLEKTDESDISEQTTEVPFSATILDLNGANKAFRDKAASDFVTAEWRVLNNSGYRLNLQLDRYSAGTGAAKRQIHLKIPKGVLVQINTLNNLIGGNILGYQIINKNEDVVYKISSDFIQSTFVNQSSASISEVTDATIVFDINPAVGTVGFSLNLLPNYEDGTENSPNFWTGVSGDSLTRSQPVEISLIDNETDIIKELVLDDIVIPSSVDYSVITGDSAVSGSTTPGAQVLDDVMQMYMQPRVRNMTERDNDNARYMGNVSFEAYVPYKKLSDGSYVSAKLETAEMDAWIAGITSRNKGIPLLKYKYEKAPYDDRIIVTYYFADQSQEYLLQVVNLQMYYSFYSDPAEDPSGRGKSFAEEDTIFYTNANLGRTFYNYQYDEQGVASMHEREICELKDSTRTVAISSKENFDFAFLSRSSTYTPIATANTNSTTLLGYALLTNKSTAKGNVRVNYQFDTGNQWNYGVTTVQFWTVDNNYQENGVTAKDYTYNFDFVLQEKGTTNVLTGNYSLTPSREYAGVKITRTDSLERDLLTYANARYYYYVNREMLAKGLTDQEKQGVNLDNYYIKELSYDLYVSASGSSNYISGDSGRPKESGGQFYGYTFGAAGKSGVARFSVDSASSKLQGNVTTRIVDKLADNSPTPDLTLLINENMTVKNEAGELLSTLDHQANIGEKITVSATAFACFYPYGITNYSPNPVFIIRTPLDLDLDSQTIKLTQDGNTLDYTIDGLGTLKDDSRLYYVTVKNSQGIGYFNERREVYGTPISISYDLKVNNRAREEAIRYRELLFITDANYRNGVGGSYNTYRFEDTLGINERLVERGKAKFSLYTITTGGVTTTHQGVVTTKSGSQFTTGAAELNVDLETELDSGITNAEVIDPLNPENGGVLDDEGTDFNLNFSMSNTVQYGSVAEDGMFVFYLPIAKTSVKPEWNSGSINDFSLRLEGPVTVNSSKGVTYEIGYTTEIDKKFNNSTDTFTGDDKYANYVSYDTIQSAGSLADVTMVKVIARKSADNKDIIPFGEEMVVTMPLLFDEGNNEKAFAQYTGQKTTWRPYVIQIYSLNEKWNEFQSYGAEKTVRIRYRDEQQVDIWAYNETDYPGGISGDIVMNKEATVELPVFNQQFNLLLEQFSDSSLTNMFLAAISEFADSDKPVSFGNTTFGFTNSLLGVADNPTNLDLHEAYQAGGNNALAIGKTTTDGNGTKNTLHYKIYNGENINDPSGERKIKITYTSIADNGDPTDDIALTVVLNIKRKISVIDAVISLIAGKEYYAFPDSPDNSTTTLTDGAFTVQFAYDPKALPTFSEVANTKQVKTYLEFGTAGGLPAGATILMKVQSSYTDNGLQRVKPEYYYYKNDTTATRNEVELTDFKKMGTSNEKLTLAQIDAHVAAVEDKTEGKLSYLFVVDFANGNTVTATTNSINLKYSIDGSPSEEGTIPTYAIQQKRAITNVLTKPSVTEIYAQKEPLQIEGSFSLSNIGSVAVDAYNKDKALSLNLRLYKDGQAIDWPQGVLIHSDQIGSTGLVPRVINNNLQFIYPVDLIPSNSTETLSYKFSLHSELEAFLEGDYTIEVTSWRDLSALYPLNGDELSMDSLDFSIVAQEKSGLEVTSTLAERFLYNKKAGQSAELIIKHDNLTKIEAILQKKNLLGNYERVLAPEDVITNFTSSVNLNSGETLSVSFDSDLVNGEYRILYKGYEQLNASVADVETEWTFIVWDAP